MSLIASLHIEPLLSLHDLVAGIPHTGGAILVYVLAGASALSVVYFGRGSSRGGSGGLD